MSLLSATANTISGIEALGDRPWARPGGELGWLDVGAGTGCLTKVACECWGFTNCTAIDYGGASSGSKDTAQGIFHNALRSVTGGTRGMCMRVDQYDGWTLPFANASFDVVSFSFVLHHVGSTRAQRRLLDEARRVSRRHVVLGEDTIENAADFNATRRHAVEHGMNSDPGAAKASVCHEECFHSEDGWRQLLGERGLDVERVIDLAIPGSWVPHNRPFFQRMIGYEVSRRLLLCSVRRPVPEDRPPIAPDHTSPCRNRTRPAPASWGWAERAAGARFEGTEAAGADRPTRSASEAGGASSDDDSVFGGFGTTIRDFHPVDPWDPMRDDERWARGDLDKRRQLMP